MITVFGHKNPDTDAICSAIAYADYLSQKGNKVRPVALGSINNETRFVLEQVGVTSPEIVSDLPEGSVIALVDHNEASQSIAQRETLSIHSVIDHHKVGDFSTSKPLTMIVQPVGCTCTILAQLYQWSNLTPRKEIAHLMISAIISDTLYYRSPTTTSHDKEAINWLNNFAQIQDLEKYSLEMFAAKSDLGDIPVEKLLNLDYKIFEKNGKRYGVGVMETTNPGYALGRKEEILEALRQKQSTENLSFILFCVVDILTEKNTAFIIDKSAEEMVQKAFNASTQHHEADLGNRVSRKSQIIPALEAVL